MLPTPRPAVAICWTCGQPGAHGSADECIAALKRAAANILAVTPASRAVCPIVVRYVAKTMYRIVFWGTSVDQAVSFINKRRQKGGVVARNLYWIERAGVSATRR